MRAIEIVTINKNLVTEAAQEIRRLQSKYNVTTSNVIVDEDGVGGGVKDIIDCKGFVNNSRPIEVEDGNEIVKPNFDNLKSQCYFKLADVVNKGMMYVDSDGGVKEKIIEELEVVKQKDIDSDMKKGVLTKDKVKELIGRSPDYSDNLMMRMYFEIQPESWSAWGG